MTFFLLLTVCFSSKKTFPPTKLRRKGRHVSQLPSSRTQVLVLPSPSLLLKFQNLSIPTPLALCIFKITRLEISSVASAGCLWAVSELGLCELVLCVLRRIPVNGCRSSSGTAESSRLQRLQRHGQFWMHYTGRGLLRTEKGGQSSPLPCWSSLLLMQPSI